MSCDVAVHTTYLSGIVRLEQNPTYSKSITCLNFKQSAPKEGNKDSKLSLT